jgi:hypothetical protein
MEISALAQQSHETYTSTVEAAHLFLKVCVGACFRHGIIRRSRLDWVPPNESNKDMHIPSG